MADRVHVQSSRHVICKYSLDDLNSFEDEAGDWLDDDEMDFDYSPEDDNDSSGNVGDHQSTLVAHLSSESV